MQLGCNKKKYIDWFGAKMGRKKTIRRRMASKRILRKRGAYVLDTCLTILQ